MSALAEALVAAQRRALTAMEKQYAAGKLDGDAARSLMDAIGTNDGVDQERLLAALDVIRTYGAQLPAEPAPQNGEPATPPETQPASEKQRAFIQRLADEKNLAAPEVPITKQEAHEIIEALKAGTYDPNKYSIPF